MKQKKKCWKTKATYAIFKLYYDASDSNFNRLSTVTWIDICIFYDEYINANKTI